MKKILPIIGCIFGLLLLTVSCNKTKTYAERLKDEGKAIDKFISQNRLVVLKSFPANSVFKENEFYRDPSTGVYYSIVELGDTTHVNMASPGEEIYVRFSGLRYFTSGNDTTEFSNLDPIRSPFPETLIYRGPVNAATSSLYSSTTPGWAVPLRYVGHLGRVKLIVPFTMGSYSDQQGYATTYYESVQYRFASQS